MLFLSEDTKHVMPGVGSADMQELDVLCESMGFKEGHFAGSFGNETGGFEILLEATSAFDALDRDMMLHEAKAMASGLTYLDEGVLGDYWKKLKEIIAGAWRSITDWLKKTWDNISARFQNAQKWLKENGKKIDDSTVVKVKTYPNIAKGSMTYAKLGITIPPASADVKAHTKFQEELTKKESDTYDSSSLRMAILGAKEASEQDMKAGTAKAIINGYNKWVAEAKVAETEMAAATKSAITLCDAAIKDTAGQNKGAGEKSAALNKAAITSNRRALAIQQRNVSIFVSACNSACSDAFQALKKAVREKK